MGRIVWSIGLQIESKQNGDGKRLEWGIGQGVIAQIDMRFQAS